jgi:hypothetical protein
MDKQAKPFFGPESQNAKILKHLKSGRSITAIEALELYGCFRLAARIANIEKKGFIIDSKYETRGGKTYSRYTLK